jgi:hypothetical protein
MWEFIVLGQVPGINIQINFWAWLAVVPPALLFAFVLWRVRKQKTLNFLLIVASLYMQRGSIRRRQLA